MRTFLYLCLVHVISRPALTAFWTKHSDSKTALQIWFKKVELAKWKSVNELKSDFPSADYIGDNRVVFNIKGNNYRIITVIYFDGQKVYIRFVGTHTEYDKIDAKTI